MLQNLMQVDEGWSFVYYLCYESPSFIYSDLYY